jgi:hypothetical protein
MPLLSGRGGAVHASDLNPSITLILFADPASRDDANMPGFLSRGRVLPGALPAIGTTPGNGRALALRGRPHFSFDQGV